MVSFDHWCDRLKTDNKLLYTVLCHSRVDYTYEQSQFLVHTPIPSTDMLLDRMLKITFNIVRPEDMRRLGIV